MSTKCLRIFAGPNGSGKSSLYKFLISQNYFHKYYFINADEIAKGLANGYSFTNWPIDISENDYLEFLKKSSFNDVIDIEYVKKYLSFKDSVFTWNGEINNLTYISASIADYLRTKFLNSYSSFSFETVFSHPSKLDFIKQAKEKGFKIYLYFISTRSPTINENRVENRALTGGHSVPLEKINSRYYKCLDNLYDAIKLCDKVFLFDNSESKNELTYNNFAEIVNGECCVTAGTVPEWFIKYVYNKTLSNIT